MADCYGDWRDWLPIVGCQWKAGAREGRAQASELAAHFSASLGAQARAVLGEDWFAGMNALLAEGRQDGVLQAADHALSLAGPALLYQSGQFIDWTADRADAALRWALGKQQEWLGARVASDIELGRLPPGEAAAIRKQYRSGDYRSRVESARDLSQKLATLVATVRGLGDDARNAATAAGAAIEADRAAGAYGAWDKVAIAAASTVTIAAAGSIAVALYSLFDWLKAREVEQAATARTRHLDAIRADEAAGRVPAGTAVAAEQAAAAQAAADAERAKAAAGHYTWQDVGGKALDALPWIVGGGVVLYFAPLVLPVLKPVTAAAGAAIGGLLGTGRGAEGK